MIEIRYHWSKTGRSPFLDWFESLAIPTRARVAARLARIRDGNLGDYKALEGGVCELRLAFGPGFRVYFAWEARRIVILLCGGDKGSQRGDIRRAARLYKEHVERRDESNR